jgi:hypothetical protein
MSEASLLVHECPGCGKAIEPGEDYVVPREYALAPDFSLHMKGDEVAAAGTQRFTYTISADGLATTSTNWWTSAALGKSSVAALGLERSRVRDLTHENQRYVKLSRMDFGCTTPLLAR